MNSLGAYAGGIPHNLSAGVTVQPSYTNNLDGTITVTEIKVNLYDNGNFDGVLQEYKIAEATLALGDNEPSFIVASYNNGSPEYQVLQTVDTINESTIVPVFTLYRVGTQLCVLDWDTLGKGLANKIHSRLVKTNRFAVESGLGISESVGHVISISSGVLWNGAHRVTLGSVVSDVDSSYLWVKTLGVWGKQDVTSYPVDSYQGLDDSLLLNNNDFGVVWVYRCASDSKNMRFLLGTDSYNKLGEAQSSGLPSDVPGVITYNSLLIGRIIFEKNAATPSTVESALTTEFETGAITDHNTLSGLDGGSDDDTEFYHLSKTDYEKVRVSAESTEVTGFDHLNPNTMGDVSVDLNAHTITIEPKVGETELVVYVQGIKYVFTTPQSVTIATPTTGMHWIYFNDVGVLTHSNVVDYDVFYMYALVSIFYYNATSDEFIVARDERHGILMSGADHEYLHRTEGTRYVSGMYPDLSNNASTLGVGGISAGLMFDEDLHIAIGAATTLPIWYRVGLDWYKTGSSNILSIEYGTTGRPAYNTLNGGLWEQADPGNNDYVVMHLVAVGGIGDEYALVQGQADYASRASARAGIYTEVAALVLEGLPTAEFIFIGSFILDENRQIYLTDEGEVYLDLRTTKVNGIGITPSDHENLSGLQGGVSGEHVHLTLAEYNSLIALIP
jgi:hypothetical protein